MTYSPTIPTALAFAALIGMPLAHAITLPTPNGLPTVPELSAPTLPSTADVVMPSLPNVPLGTEQTPAPGASGSVIWQVLPTPTLQALQQTPNSLISFDMEGRPLLDRPLAPIDTRQATKPILGTPCFVSADGLELSLRFDEIPRRQSVDLAEATLITLCPPGYRFRYVISANMLATRQLTGTVGPSQRVVLELFELGGSPLDSRVHVGTGKAEAVRVIGQLSTSNGERFREGTLRLDPGAQLTLQAE